MAPDGGPSAGAPTPPPQPQTMNKITRRILLLFLSIAILALVFIPLGLPNRNAAPPTVDVAFLGFTNSGTHSEALFAFTNPPPVAVSLYSVHDLAPVPPGSAVKDRGSFSWGRRDPWGLLYAVWVDT